MQHLKVQGPISQTKNQGTCQIMGYEADNGAVVELQGTNGHSNQYDDFWEKRDQIRHQGVNESSL